MANNVTASVNVSCAAINVSFVGQKGLEGKRWLKKGEGVDERGSEGIA